MPEIQQIPAKKARMTITGGKERLGQLENSPVLHPGFKTRGNKC